MFRVLILGAGGHAQVVADILLQGARSGEQLRPIGFLDDDVTLTQTRYMGLPVLGDLTQIDSIEHDGVIVAIGENRVRRCLFDALEEKRVPLASAVHPGATVSPHASIGTGTMICAGVVVNVGATIGSNVILNTGCTIDHHCHVASHVHIAPGVHLAGGVTVGTGAFIGIGTAVTAGRSIGEWSTVAAGAVVTKDIPDGAVVAGAPARVIRMREATDGLT